MDSLFLTTMPPGISGIHTNPRGTKGLLNHGDSTKVVRWPSQILFKTVKWFIYVFREDAEISRPISFVVYEIWASKDKQSSSNCIETWGEMKKMRFSNITKSQCTQVQYIKGCKNESTPQKHLRNDEIDTL